MQGVATSRRSGLKSLASGGIASTGMALTEESVATTGDGDPPAAIARHRASNLRNAATRRFAQAERRDRSRRQGICPRSLPRIAPIPATPCIDDAWLCPPRHRREQQDHQHLCGGQL